MTTCHLKWYISMKTCQVTHYAHDTPTCLFTRLDSLPWSQQGFWRLSICRNCILWSFGCHGETRLMLVCIACLVYRKTHPSKLYCTFPFIHTADTLQTPKKQAEKPQPSSPITTKALKPTISAGTGQSKLILGVGPGYFSSLLINKLMTTHHLPCDYLQCQMWRPWQYE